MVPPIVKEYKSGGGSLQVSNRLAKFGPYRVFVGSLTFGVGVWGVLYADFGEKEHCFTGLRKQYQKGVDAFFGVK